MRVAVQRLMLLMPGVMAALFAAMAQARALEPDDSRAAVNYQLNCAGCHLPDGAGRAGLVPALAGSLGKIISIPGGREYIGRIPGVANSFMSDGELADVLNWALYRFDSQHLPVGLMPYSAEEVGRLRKHPMSDSMVRRATLMRDGQTTPPSGTAAVAAVPAAAVPVQPPAAFVLCGACHPTSSNAANGIGPNLRGVMGRTSGQVANYMYSAAMKNAGIVWGPETLDAYITAPAAAVPGNAMTYRGQPDAAARAAIIAYLQTLH